MSQRVGDNNVYGNVSSGPDPRNVVQFQRYRSDRLHEMPGSLPPLTVRGSQSSGLGPYPSKIGHVGPTPTTAATVGSRNSNASNNPVANVNRSSYGPGHRRLDALPRHRQDGVCREYQKFAENSTGSNTSPAVYRAIVSKASCLSPLNVPSQFPHVQMPISEQSTSSPASRRRREIYDTYRSDEARHSGDNHRSGRMRHQSWKNSGRCKKGIITGAVTFVLACMFEMAMG